MKETLRWLFVGVLLVAGGAACGSGGEGTPAGAGEGAQEAAAPAEAAPEAPPAEPAGSEATATAGGEAAATESGAAPVLVVETVKGTFEIETYPQDAPRSVEHIVALVKRNFYNGLRVHRVEPGFVVQFGDPQTRDMTKRAAWGTRGSGRQIGVAEIKRTHRLGAVALAHAGDPRGADSQMYIALNGPARYSHMEGDYTVFGQVISGMDVVQKLEVTDVIRRISLKQGGGS